MLIIDTVGYLSFGPIEKVFCVHMHNTLSRIVKTSKGTRQYTSLNVYLQAFIWQHVGLQHDTVRAIAWSVLCSSQRRDVDVDVGTKPTIDKFRGLCAQHASFLVSLMVSFTPLWCNCMHLRAWRCRTCVTPREQPSPACCLRQPFLFAQLQPAYVALSFM